MGFGKLRPKKTPIDPNRMQPNLLGKVTALNNPVVSGAGTPKVGNIVTANAIAPLGTIGANSATTLNSSSNTPGGGIGPDVYKDQLATNPLEVCPRRTIGGAMRSLKGFQEIMLQRLNVVSELVLKKFNQENTGIIAVAVNFLSGVITTGNFGVDPTTVVGLLDGITGGMVSTATSMVTETAVGRRIVAAVNRYNAFIEKEGQYFSAVTAAFAADYAEGNSINIDYGAQFYSAQMFLVQTEVSCSIDSPYLHLSSSQQIINQSRFYHVVADLFQSNNFHFGVSAEDLMTLNSRNTFRINRDALREVSSEAEYVAGTNVIYGDVLWHQAGQPSGQPITDKVTYYDPQFASQIANKLIYGTIVNAAQNHYYVFAKNGGYIQYSGLFATMDAPVIFLNSTYMSGALLNLGMKSFTPIPNTQEYPKDNEQVPQGVDQEDPQTMKPPYCFNPSNYPDDAGYAIGSGWGGGRVVDPNVVTT